MARPKLHKADAGSNVGDLVITVDGNKEPMYKRALPKETVHYLEFECPFPYAYVQIYGAYRKLKTKEALMTWLTRSASAQHAAAYEVGYPRRFP